MVNLPLNRPHFSKSAFSRFNTGPTCYAQLARRTSLTLAHRTRSGELLGWLEASGAQLRSYNFPTEESI
jgi:hypothetical protein